VDERVAPIGRGEAIFASSGELHEPAPLEITLVDPTTRRVRRAPVMRRSAGAFVQVWGRHRAGDGFTFIGDLGGTLSLGDQRLHADVRYVQTMDGNMAFAPLWFCGALEPRRIGAEVTGGSMPVLLPRDP
jgi:hypothetical protein